MTNPSRGPERTDPLLTSCATVVMAVRLLRDRSGQLSDQDREDVWDLLVRRADELAAGVRELVQTGRASAGRSRDQERIDELETAAELSRDRIEALEAAALDSEAAALVTDARIQELAAEVDQLRATRDRGAVIEAAKEAVRNLMQISDDAAFAVLVAASQRDEVSLYTVAHRLAASTGRLGAEGADETAGPS